MSLWRWGFEVSCAQTMPSIVHSLSLLSMDQDVELSTPLAPSLSVCCHASYHDANELIAVLYKSCHGHAVSSQQ